MYNRLTVKSSTGKLAVEERTVVFPIEVVDTGIPAVQAEGVEYASNTTLVRRL
jgi:hypothetical protein